MFSALRVLKSKDAIIYVALKMKFPSSLGIVSYKKKKKGLCISGISYKIIIIIIFS
jgi:hypothetical protein